MRHTVYLLLAALLLLAGHSSQAATFKVATLSPDGSFWMKTMREAGKEIEAATDNRVKFKWYPGGVMGDDKAVLRKMRVGQLQGAALAMGELVSFYPDSQAYGVPFLFRNY
jgi:TRAP-type C4-dicarboxylate transport system substrate-binding protein